MATNAPPGDPDVATWVAVLGLRNKIAVSGGRDRRVATIAAHQRGRANRRQLLAAGLSASQITRMIAAGRLFPRHAGVYAVGHPADVPLARETEALLATRPGALLSHTTALRLWGVIDDDGHDLDVHVLVDRPYARHPSGVRVHRTCLLEPRDRRLRERLPVVSPARALLDAATMLDDRRLERTHDRLLVARLLRGPELDELLHRAGRHAGVPILRELSAEHGRPVVTRSEAEERVLELIDGAGLPRPRVNARLHGYEVDLHWPDAALVVEVDGYRFHRTRRAFEDDRARDVTLAGHGIVVLRVTWRQLTGQPSWIVAQIATALATRG